MLKEEKMKELLLKDIELENYYKLEKNGFYKLNDIAEKEKKKLRKKLKNIQFTALNFTDSRNVYQFYPLERLWNDIQICLKNSIKLWHPATEPISTSELYKVLAGENFENKILDEPLKKEIFLYLIFGILTTIVNIVSFFVFNKLFNYKLSNIIAFILAIVFAYIMNKCMFLNQKGKKN